MNILNRRSFLRAGSAGIAAGAMMNVPGFMQSAMAQNPGVSWNGKKVMFLFLRGGNDGLNTVVPLGDPAYGSSIRPSISIQAPSGGLATGGQAPTNPQAGRAIDLGNGFMGLHPAMTDLIPLYNAGELAVVHRVGYPRQSRSHFDSEYYWETGVPRDDSVTSGMLYRAVTETGWHESNTLPAVTLQSNMPRILRGDIPLTNINNPSRYDLLGVYNAARVKHLEAISRMHGLRAPDRRYREMLFPSGKRFVDSIEVVKAIDFSANGLDESDNKIAGSPFLDDDVAQTHLFPVSRDTDDRGFDSYSAWSFFRSLKNAAQLLANTDAIISGTQLGGFDTHGDQGGASGNHARLMERVAWGLYALRTYMSHPSIDIWKDTMIVVLSEFGRTTIENGDNGTDHAEAAPMLIAGGPADFNGGLYECSPNDPVTPWVPGTAGQENGSMFGVNDRYLERSCDYRSVMGEVIREHLGATQEQLDRIIPGYAEPGERLMGGGVSIDGTMIKGEVGLFG